MKSFSLLLLIVVSVEAFSQPEFDDFLKELPTFNYPLDYGFLEAKKITINRKTCWKYWVLPITKVNKNKPDSLNSFPFDSAEISLSEWNKRDWNKKEPIRFYCAIMTGELYCCGKTTINDKTIGILWYFFQKDFLYGYGRHFWLGTYDLKGNLMDYIKLYENISCGVVDFNSYKCERKFKFTSKNKLVLLDKAIHCNGELDSLNTITKKIDTTFSRQSFSITNGKFIIDAR